MKREILYIIILLIITNISIIIDIPFLRQSLPFLFFTIIPGYLLVKSFSVKPLEKSVLSVGLSLALLMFVGLFLNNLYPLIPKPLSLIPLLISLNILIVVLLTIYIIYMKKTANGTDFSPRKELMNLFFHPIVFYPLFLPILTVLGSYMMNNYSNNSILLFMLFSIPLYLVFLALEKREIPHIVYPVTLYCIGISLLLLNTLPSNYLIGRDIHMEYYCFKKCLINHHWDITAPSHPYNNCLSVTILPTIYKYLLNVPSILIFKFYYCIIGAIVPLPMYILARRMLKSRKLGFYATLLLMFQFAYVYMGQYVRQLIAFIFFAIAIMILTSPIKKHYKKAIFISFIFTTIFSHYTSAYVFFIVVALPPFIIWASKHLNGKFRVPWKHTQNFSNKNIAVLFFVAMFLWYAQVTNPTFKSTFNVILNTFKAMVNFFSPEFRNYSEQAVLGIGVANFPSFLSVIVHDLIFGITSVGVLVLFFKEKYRKNYRINDEYIASTIVILAILISFVILPYVSKAYGGSRLFSQLLVILAPCFIIGVRFIVDYAKKFKIPFEREKLIGTLLLALLILGFICTNYLQYEFFGIPYSYAYDNWGDRRYETYIYDSEITGAQWLNNHYNKNAMIHTDRVGSNRIILGFDEKANIDNLFFNNTGPFRRGDYIYLRHLNINEGLVLKQCPTVPPKFVNGKLKIDNLEPITQYSWLFADRSVIYDSGGSMVLI